MQATNLVISQPQVRNILPSRFSEDYPNLVEFLEKYYEAPGGLHNTHSDILSLRLLDETSLDRIDNIFFEVGNSIRGNIFSDPVLIAKIISLVVRSKGTPLSAQLFFRSFFNTEPTISYPKEEIFTVGVSLVGPEYGFRIINNDRWQIHSVLIKSDVQQKEWADLYRIFVHPAGFWVGSEVLIERTGQIVLTGPISEASVDFVTVETTSTITQLSPMVDITLLPDSSYPVDSDTIMTRMSALKTISYFDSSSIEDISNQYGSISLFGGANSITMDADSAGAPDMSNTYETFDMARYDSNNDLS